MSEGMPYADIVILALVAGFILLRLRSVLGQKSDQDPMNLFRKDASLKAEPLEPVVHADEKLLKPKKDEPDVYVQGLGNSELAQQLNALRIKDPQFNAGTFLIGAKLAFEMVFDAFAKGDKATLKMLLSDPIYQHFATEIDERAKQENHPETTLLAVISKEITAAALEGNITKLTVKFVSEQVSLVRDKEGKIIEGNASDSHNVEDEWIFERDVTSKNPNWKIIET